MGSQQRRRPSQRLLLPPRQLPQLRRHQQLQPRQLRRPRSTTQTLSSMLFHTYTKTTIKAMARKLSRVTRTLQALYPTTSTTTAMMIASVARRRRTKTTTITTIKLILIGYHSNRIKQSKFRTNTNKRLTNPNKRRTNMSNNRTSTCSSQTKLSKSQTNTSNSPTNLHSSPTSSPSSLTRATKIHPLASPMKKHYKSTSSQCFLLFALL